ncbi:general odorant-binding protein 28a [Plodia interpunctella]|uniref:general odorant-binding protein 28a n=1 Tax=Plodia interpunctella TaxID=58824 RepID=UPI0023689B30|nr:general odorant-binding protein 28a-like [Plodia interpunctella]XP_053608377.1 general odorant-binding protein 28a-like [Plodia interpunctella]
MEYLAVLLALATTAMANDTAENVATLQAKFVTAGEACIEEYPISGEDITLFKSGQFPDSEHAGCFSACVLRNIGLFDDKGSLYQPDNLEKATEIFNEEKEIETIKELISTCAKVNEETVTDGEKGCERAKLLFHCFVENSK